MRDRKLLLDDCSEISRTATDSFYIHIAEAVLCTELYVTSSKPLPVVQRLVRQLSSVRQHKDEAFGACEPFR